MAQPVRHEAADTGSVVAMQAGSAGRNPSAERHASRPGRLGGVRARTGDLAPIVLCAGLGLLICSIANALSRATLAPSPFIYWAGLLLVALPIFYGLTSRDASPRQRLALVCLLGLSLYAVKVIRDAPLFTFSDELVHAFNAEQIGAHHHLFHANPILPVTPYYPGLEGATSALMELAGISSFAAGAIVVGVARVTLVIAMFLLFGRISGSARTAGLGVAIFTGNFNFLFWGAQYSYESLALPLLLVVMMALSEREAAGPPARNWAVPIVLGTAAIVVTHHLTSYALAVFLVSLALAHRFVRRNWAWPNPWPFAVLAVVLAAIWLAVVANSTIGYLFPVISDAVHAAFTTASGEAPSRGLFQTKTPVAEATPVVARAIAFFAVALLAAGLPFGLRRLWRRHRSKPFALIFSLAALGFFGTLALRLAPAAWETGNRIGEFLFIGLAFVLACAGLETWRPPARPWLGRVLLTAGLGVVLLGGAIAGWPWDLQLASPLRARASGGTIVSPPLGLAEWAKRNTPENARFAASPADAQLLMVSAGRTALAGKSPDIEDILNEAALSRWELPLLKRYDIRYVVADRREIASDAMRGYFFSVRGNTALSRELPKTAAAKFGGIPGAARVYANGSIAVYDLGARR
jgi:hypothetical protein